MKCFKRTILKGNIKQWFRRHVRCKHQFRLFNKWCNECSEFGHGVKVYHCFKCNRYHDEEFGFWTKQDIENVFFNYFNEITEG